ncbi:hypothetical protein ACWF99_01520 [Nocardia sp. NPDC055002]|uniref:hypothetical protein n=1 Tax=Nocardia sp. NPDC056952 TaxID=3345979 RepID=UPI0036430686
MNERAEPGRIIVDYSHLFPGVVVRADRMADEFDVVFSDGMRTEAGILQDDDGVAALDVVGYATAAGTMQPGRVWPITSIEDAGSEVNIKLGPYLR